MVMKKVPGLRKYRSSDRSHIKLPARLWTKAELAEWKGQINESCRRGMEYMAKGDMRSALSVLLELKGLEGFGIVTPEALDYRSLFYAYLPKP